MVMVIGAGWVEAGVKGVEGTGTGWVQLARGCCWIDVGDL